MPKGGLTDLIPQESLLCLTVELLLLLRLSFIYSSHFKVYPILTSMISNALLNGLSDTFAQTLTIIKDRRRHADIDKDAIQLREEFELPVASDMLRGAARQFDYERQMRFIGYGFLGSIIGFSWLQFLESRIPMVASSAVFKRVLADQVFFAPFSLFLFFGFMNTMEGNSLYDLRKRMRKQYLPALKANYLLWPLVQFINFTYMPLMYQLPFVGCINLGWTIYLSIVLGKST